jgi:hypothetical protein
LAAIHPGVEPEDVSNTVSPIPFDAESDFGKQILNLFPGSGSAKAKDWFRDAPRASEISITTYLSAPMQPMAFNSIMERIASQWSKESTSSASRSGFYNWRRARPLVEFIPAAPGKVDSMVRGFLLADILGQIRTSTDNDLGVRIEVWDPTLGYVSFPYPLLHPGTPAVPEYLGTILESLAIALVLSSSNFGNPLEPLRAYHRLLDLGADSSQVSSRELQAWIRDGVLPAGAPQVLPGGGDPASRVQFLEEKLMKKKESSQKAVDAVHDKGDPFTTSRAWEVHPLRVKAISDLEMMISSLGEVEEM